ncbi:diphthine synthase [Candidatus Nanohalococcus occultus]|uniref:Diphthine synthase n=1 Tax=Candidatus Nanohalococcus occultus TaxID=2978047 RepID=A0ABY8CFP2_9ARCH|nr:Diphthine synthase [Candidatus Nanohaloarchaeota archaeon SVXNc]
MLYLVGLGLDDGEITQKGLKALENAEKAYAEFYTNTETVSVEELEEKTGTEIEKLSREKVEQEDIILESAEEKDTAFLVSGDPLTATTHYEIKHRAVQRGIETTVVHAPSIFTSIAETGLNVYKFGRTVTLPEDFAPESITEHIEKNDSIGLHTLVLLDINYDGSKAADKLVKIDESLEGRRAVLVERANADSMNAKVIELGEEFETGETPHCLAIVGKTDHMEEEFLESHDG